MSWYFEVQNVLNRRNVWTYIYEDGSKLRKTVDGLAFWPMAGLVIEF